VISLRALALAALLGVSTIGRAQAGHPDGTINAGESDYSAPAPTTVVKEPGREWYIYSFPAQQCEVAKTSPKEFYDALDADGDGPTLNRVNGPNGGLAQVSIQYPVEGNPDMVNLVQFFTSDGFCEAYRRQQIHQNDDLK
jgi:hypothetical protein